MTYTQEICRLNSHAQLEKWARSDVVLIARHETDAVEAPRDWADVLHDRHKGNSSFCEISEKVCRPDAEW